MRRLALLCVVATLAAGVAAVAAGQNKGEGKPSVVADSPSWQKLKTLVGRWEADLVIDGKPVVSALEVRMTGDGSALIYWMDKDTPHEMVTMIHPDGKRILATHYCAAHNQPRLALVPSKAPNQVAFQFVDGTNIAPGDAHMGSVVFTFVDAVHHDAAWTDSASPSAMVFKYTRKK